MEETPGYSCQICRKVLKSEAELRLHEQSYNNVQSCDACKMTFFSDLNLHLHKKFQCPSSKEMTVNHKCDLCQKTFKYKSILQRHMDRVHKSVKEFQCSICQLKLASNWLLETHTRLHAGGKSLFCSTCGKSFATKSALYCHETTHGRGGNYRCSVCHKQFMTLAQLQDHMKIHTVQKPSARSEGGGGAGQGKGARSDIPPAIGPSELAYSCANCGNSFPTGEAKWQHESKCRMIKEKELHSGSLGKDSGPDPALRRGKRCRRGSGKKKQGADEQTENSDNDNDNSFEDFNLRKSKRLKIANFSQDQMTDSEQRSPWSHSNCTNIGSPRNVTQILQQRSGKPVATVVGVKSVSRSAITPVASSSPDKSKNAITEAPAPVPLDTGTEKETSEEETLVLDTETRVTDKIEVIDVIDIDNESEMASETSFVDVENAEDENDPLEGLGVNWVDNPVTVASSSVGSVRVSDDQEKNADSTRRYQCVFCIDNFDNLERLQKHQAMHIESQHFECIHCERSFTCLVAFMTHRVTCDNQLDVANESGSGTNGQDQDDGLDQVSKSAMEVQDKNLEDGCDDSDAESNGTIIVSDSDDEDRVSGRFATSETSDSVGQRNFEEVIGTSQEENEAMIISQPFSHEPETLEGGSRAEELAKAMLTNTVDPSETFWSLIEAYEQDQVHPENFLLDSESPLFSTVDNPNETNVTKEVDQLTEFLKNVPTSYEQDSDELRPNTVDFGNKETCASDLNDEYLKTLLPVNDKLPPELQIINSLGQTTQSNVFQSQESEEAEVDQCSEEIKPLLHLRSLMRRSAQGMELTTSHISTDEPTDSSILLPSDKPASPPRSQYVGFDAAEDSPTIQITQVCSLSDQGLENKDEEVPPTPSLPVELLPPSTSDHLNSAPLDRLRKSMSDHNYADACGLAQRMQNYCPRASSKSVEKRLDRHYPVLAEYINPPGSSSTGSGPARKPGWKQVFPDPNPLTLSSESQKSTNEWEDGPIRLSTGQETLLTKECEKGPNSCSTGQEAPSHTSSMPGTPSASSSNPLQVGSGSGSCSAYNLIRPGARVIVRPLSDMKLKLLSLKSVKGGGGPPPKLPSSRLNKTSSQKLLVVKMNGRYRIIEREESKESMDAKK